MSDSTLTEHAAPILEAQLREPYEVFAFKLIETLTLGLSKIRFNFLWSKKTRDDPGLNFFT